MFTTAKGQVSDPIVQLTLVQPPDVVHTAALQLTCNTAPQVFACTDNSSDEVDDLLYIAS